MKKMCMNATYILNSAKKRYKFQTKFITIYRRTIYSKNNVHQHFSTEIYLNMYRIEMATIFPFSAIY